MRIGIVSTVNQKHMTLISHYTEILDYYNISYDLIYIDKYNEEESYINAERKYKYNLELKKEWNFIRKVIAYFKGRKYLIKNLKDNQYDFIIVWNTFTGVMLIDFLIRRYKKKFFLNIRDYAFEKNPIIYFLVNKLVENSYFTTISSPGFKSFLPPQDYLMIHSFNEKLLTESTQQFKRRNNKSPLRITFIGNIRFYKQNKELLLNLKNDERFTLQYFGTNSEILEEFAKEKDITNVKFMGSFNPLDTDKLLAETDLINNMYGNEDIALETALSIRLYYAAYRKIPILTSPNTFMSEISNETSLGIDVSTNEPLLGNKIYKYYHSIDEQKFNENSKEFLRKTIKDNEQFKKKFSDIIKSRIEGEKNEKRI